jgi:hypothetical protein
MVPYTGMDVDFSRVWVKALRPTGRGMSLGGTLLAVAVLSLLAFCIASLSVTHLRLSSRQEHGLAAANAARSAVSNSISQILQNQDFGKAGEEVRLETADTTGLVTFNKGAGSYSTNNLDGTENVPGVGGTMVPSATVFLIGVGRSGGVERRVEAVLRVPPFPWAIASGGNVDTRNGVLVAALPHGVWPPPTDLRLLHPADIVANGSKVSLGTNSIVLGDVESVGQVELGPSPVTVLGERRENSDRVELPKLRPEDQDPGPTAPPLGDASTPVTGTARAVGPVVLNNTLVINNGLVYVEGDLTLNRGVQGIGILVATGNITVRAGANLEGLSELAVISGGHVSLSGSGANRATIRGLFYAEQGLDATELTLVGSLVTGEASTGLILDKVNVYYQPPGVVEVSSPGGISNGGLGVSFNSILGTVLTMVLPYDDDDAAGAATSIFYIDLQSTEGDFPVFIGVRSSDPALSIPMRGCSDEAEIDAFLAELTTLMDTIEIPAVPLTIAQTTMWYYPEIDEAAKNAVRNSVRGAVGGSSTPAGPVTAPSSSFFADISRFLPLEDRIRVVSWVER